MISNNKSFESNCSTYLSLHNTLVLNILNCGSTVLLIAKIIAFKILEPVQARRCP